LEKRWVKSSKKVGKNVEKKVVKGWQKVSKNVFNKVGQKVGKCSIKSHNYFLSYEKRLGTKVGKRVG